jgi:murein L,D-transpeptidase YcbB/YkuD
MRHITIPALAALALTACPALAQAQWSPDQVRELLGVAAQVREEGLDPADYDVTGLKSALDRSDAAGVQARATAVFLHLASDFTQGHVRNRARMAWHLPGPTLSPAAARSLLDAALGGTGVRTTLQRLLPQHRQYRLLKEALAAAPARDKAGVLRLRANLERWRWMPRELGRRYLLVNAPAFTVSLIEDNKVVSRRRVIVGKPATPTPQFAATVTGVILNPWWDVPASIVRESVGKLVATNPGQARARGYVVSGGRYRQQPGAGNALGQMKLVMPNPFTVYLHDTPNKALFDTDIRAYSHGCVRVQDALGLAETLLASTTGWYRPRIDGVLAGGRTTPVTLAQPLPVYIAYFTVAAEENGELATFPDIYGRDAPVVAALVDREGDTAP